MIDSHDARQLVGQNFIGGDGRKIGRIGQVYLDDYGNEPQWVTVHTGLFGLHESFVPLAQARLTDEGLSVPYTRETITKAPNTGEDGHLDESAVRALYDHYDVAYDEPDPDVRTTGTGPPDEAMTRSEERLDVGTEQVTRGTARLHRWVETENVQIVVPIRKEKARLVTEPVDGADLGAGEDGIEVTLSEERPVVTKETVPLERVRLEKVVVEGTETVSEDLRTERIDLDEDRP